MQHNLTKVTLSKDELELVSNAQILLTKNEIIKKVYELFGALSESFVIHAEQSLPSEIISISPKISRGENYEGLPYVMLDYPRLYKKEEAFGIRTFFWWGNFVSITLQLSGRFKNYYLSYIDNAIKDGAFSNWYIGISDNEWQHHFEANNYALISTDTNLSQERVIKLAKKIPLKEWDSIEYFLLENFSLLMKVLHH